MSIHANLLSICAKFYSECDIIIAFFCILSFTSNFYPVYILYAHIELQFDHIQDDIMSDRKPSDGAYKYLFSSTVVFHQFITRFVDEEFVQHIAPEDIEQIGSSFVSDKLVKRESDIIYKVNLHNRNVYIYVLIELQSTVDKRIPVRMLLYIAQLYDQLYRSSQKGNLPAVFPILLYNGSQKWNVPLNVDELIEQSIPARFIPSFDYYPIIEHPEETLRRVKGLIAAAVYAEQHRDDVFLRERIDDILDMIRDENPEQFRMFSHWLNQMFGKRLKEEDIERITNLEEVKSIMKQYAGLMKAQYRQEGIEQGRQEGIEQGRKDGMQEGRKETARNMLAKGSSEEFVRDVTGLSEEEIRNLKQ